MPLLGHDAQKGISRQGGRVILLDAIEGIVRRLPPRDKKPRQVKALWQDKEKPITHLIIDRDQDRSYCFGKTKDGKEEFFFELDVMVRVNPVKRDQIQPVKGLDHKRLAEVLEYVQVLPGRKKAEKKP